MMEVIDRLETLQNSLPATDGVMAFNRMYLQVTRLVLLRIEDGKFTNRTFMTRLDIIFAGLYLAQFDFAEDDLNKAWAPLFELRHSRCEPIQFALAGMNAHINYDLAVAVVSACRQLGLSPNSPGVQADYDRITGILAEVHEEVRQSFLHGVALDVDGDLAPVVTLIGNWSIGTARQAAWANALALWQIDDLPDLRREYLAAQARTVGLAGRFLLTPVAELV